VTTQSEKQLAKRDVGYHDRRLARRLQEEPEFRAEFERQQSEIAAVDAIVNQLDELRETQRMSKAELARAIDKNPAAVRRLLTASGNPELRTVVAMAQALGAEVKVIPHPRARRSSTHRRASRRSMTIGPSPAS
jgi:DNA-binding phage protein